MPPPPAPAAAVNPADPLNVVLSGMSQLQVLVSELSKKKGDGMSPETVKGVSSLPSLPEPGHEDSTLGFSDWIHGVKPAMSDLSDTSDQLWSLALQESSEWYQAYQALTPVARLGSKVVPSATLLQSKWSRTRHRMESLIAGACPSMVREELSSSRTQGLLEVLCKIHVIYRLTRGVG